MAALREMFSGRLISRFVSAMFSGQLAPQISQSMISFHGVIWRVEYSFTDSKRCIEGENPPRNRKNYTTV